MPETDPDFERLLKTVTESKLEWTYNVSLVEQDATGKTLKEYVANPRGLAAVA